VALWRFFSNGTLRLTDAQVGDIGVFVIEDMVEDPRA